MERKTRAIGTLGTAENKATPVATVKVGKTKPEVEGEVTKGKPIGTMTNATLGGLVKNG